MQQHWNNAGPLGPAFPNHRRTGTQPTWWPPSGMLTSSVGTTCRPRQPDNGQALPDATGNLFLHLRLGQCHFELDNFARAADEFAGAYVPGPISSRAPTSISVPQNSTQTTAELLVARRAERSRGLCKMR
jgi:hypothetical protein